MSYDQVRAEMIKRSDVIASAQEQERQQRQQEKLVAAGTNFDDNAMAMKDIEKQEMFGLKKSLFDASNTKKKVKAFNHEGRLPTTFFSMNSPDHIEETIAGILKEAKMEYTVDPSKYKITFTQNGALEMPGSEEGIEKYSIYI